MEQKIYFSIPDFWEKFKLNYTLADLYANEREKFNDDVVIDNIYGSFPCIWNGGRIINGETKGLNVQQTIAPFHAAGIGLRFTFTNSLIEEKHLSDTIGNTILELCKNEKIKNSVNCASSIMMDYIEQNYSNYYYCLWSTTLWEKDINTINELSKDHILVLDYSLNNNFTFLKKLKHPENIEILCSEICQDNCPFRKEHYIAISQWNMGYPVEEYQCRDMNAGRPYYETLNSNKSYVDLNNIRTNYLPLGINKFKLNGRGESPISVTERYVTYLIKPQYQNEIRNRLLLAI